MVQFERWQRIVQEVKVYSCNEKEAIVCEEVIWTPGPLRLVPPSWIGKNWMRMSKESAQVWFQELNKCTSWRWVDQKNQWSYVSMSGGFIDWLFCCCVCVMILLAEVSNISQRQVTPSVFWWNHAKVWYQYIYNYICMYVNILGLFSRWMWYKKHRACSKDSFFIFLQCLQDYAIWLMTARCLALDDGSRASSSGSQCAIAPAGDKLHSIPIDKLMEVGGSAIHSCCSRASTDTDRWQSPLGAFQFCFDNWNHSCFSAGAVIFNKREKTLSQQSFTHD